MLACTYTFYQLKSNYYHQDPPNYSNIYIIIDYYCPLSCNFQIQDLVHLHEFSRFGNIIKFHFLDSPQTLGFLPCNHRVRDNHSRPQVILIILPHLLKQENFLDLFQESQALIIKPNLETI